jgi:hypothetical protein
LYEFLALAHVFHLSRDKIQRVLKPGKASFRYVARKSPSALSPNVVQRVPPRRECRQSDDAELNGDQDGERW